MKIPLNTLVTGDITLVVYHARSTFGGKIQGKVSQNYRVPILENTVSMNE